MVDMSLALHEFLAENGIKQCYLARTCNIPSDRVSRILRGERQMRADELMCFCEALRVTPQELARRYGNRPA